MPRILFDCHEGDIKQKVGVVDETGYAMDADVIWDERRDDWSEYDESKLGGYIRVDDELVFNQAKKDAHDSVVALRAMAAQAKIDAKNSRRLLLTNIDAAQTLPELKAVVRGILEELGLL